MRLLLQLLTGCHVNPYRYHLSEDQVRDKERYAAKEREEVVRKARERKMADIKVKPSCVSRMHSLTKFQILSA